MLYCKCYCDAYLLWQTPLIKTSALSLKQNNQMTQESQ
ncbi:TPA: hypothetical protein JBK46_01325 [Legionella pneumophila]|nr:hypothetical protein DM454_03255 [Legionella pneumophila]HAT8873005.1 hypothetical protein [Legionella pneumophila subsp. pneumophila]PYB53693.1 hypothetical protein DM456_03545 [Legionella pneumophila]PYB65815.1 hypothetical protein DM455_01325 [Legionella pneumophila]RYX01243.1 hypothetical protein D7226_04220 [Legionella pneumophila]